jgi:hypothetical protein
MPQVPRLELTLLVTEHILPYPLRDGAGRQRLSLHYERYPLYKIQDPAEWEEIGNRDLSHSASMSMLFFPNFCSIVSEFAGKGTIFCLKCTMIPYKILSKVSLNVMIIYELILKKT